MGLVQIASPGPNIHAKGAVKVRAEIKGVGANGIPIPTDPTRIEFFFYAPDGTVYPWGYPSDTNPPEYSLLEHVGTGVYEAAQPLGGVKGKWTVEVKVDWGLNGYTEVYFEAVDL